MYRKRLICDFILVYKISFSKLNVLYTYIPIDTSHFLVSEYLYDYHLDEGEQYITVILSGKLHLRVLPKYSLFDVKKQQQQPLLEHS